MAYAPVSSFSRIVWDFAYDLSSGLVHLGKMRMIAQPFRQMVGWNEID